MSTEFWIGDLPRLGEIILGAVILYIFVVAFVRLMGKRATAQMNNFDWLIVVATGSLLASGILLRDISLIGAIAAMVVLGLCQYLVTKFFSANDGKLENILRASPRLLTHRGEWLEDAMRDERVSRAEVYSRLREEGFYDIDEANWVILEMDGRLSILPKRDNVDICDVKCLEGVRFSKDAIEKIDRELSRKGNGEK